MIVGTTATGDRTGNAARLSLICLLLASCASNVPAPIRESVPGDPGLATVRSDPATYVGTKVRWGGQIISVENNPNDTDVQIVGRRLERSGRPVSEDQSAGRFIARFAGFIDPAIYEANRELTVVGALIEPKRGKVGEREYTFPVVAVESDQLWSKRVPVAPYSYPYGPYPYFYDPWRGPFYDPWYWW